MPRGARRYLRPVAERKSQPERVDVDRELPDGLAGVEQVGHARVARHRAHRGGRVHQPALGRDPRDRDQPDPVVEQVAQRVDRQLPGSSSGTTSTVAPVRRATCSNADHVARVLRPRREDRGRRAANDARQRVERHVPRAGRVLDQRDLVGARADERGHRVVHRGRPFGDERRRPRTRRCAPRARGARSRCRARARGRQRGARVVEVDDVVAAGRVGPDPVDVDQCSASLSGRR